MSGRLMFRYRIMERVLQVRILSAYVTRGGSLIGKTLKTGTSPIYPTLNMLGP